MMWKMGRVEKWFYLEVEQVKDAKRVKILE